MEHRKALPLKLDYILVLSTVGLLIIGLVMVMSSSMVVAQNSYGNSFYFITRQVVFAIIGLMMALLMITIPTSYWKGIGPTWLITGLVLLVLVLIPGIGHVVNGSRRWIIFGPIAIQVSELVKLCSVMYVAGYLFRHSVA